MRIDQLTFTRFLAAISIVIFHFGVNVFPFNNKLISFFFQQADVGVSYFFVLSGFVLIIAYGNKTEINVFEYFKTRIARIYPAYLFAIIILLLFTIITSSQFMKDELILNLLVIQAWIPGKALSFNYPGWSLVVEMFFYSIFPFLLVLYKKVNYKIAAIPIVIFWGISQIILQYLSTSVFYEGFPSKSHDLIYYFPLMHLNEFLMGNLAALFFINEFKEKNGNYDFTLLAIILLLIFSLKYLTGINFHDGMLALFFIPFILFSSLNTGMLSMLFNKKVFVFFGEISYGIYILQYPVFLYASKIFSKLNIENLAIRFYGYVIILIFLSAICFKYLESPIRIFFKKKQRALNSG